MYTANLGMGLAFVGASPLLRVSSGSSRCVLLRCQRTSCVRRQNTPSSSATQVPNVGTIGSAIAAPPPPPPMQPPPGALTVAQGLGAAKAAMPAGKVLMLGVLAGAYIALGGLLALCVGGAVPAIASSNPGLQKIIFGLFGLPFGLTMVLTAGGELYTGNTALVTSALLAGRADLSGLMRNWVLSFIGNFVGSLFVVWLASQAGILSGASAATAVAIAKTKTSLSFSAAVARGVACNWLVCLAVWLASSSRDFGGKFMSVLLPVSAFVAMGCDHSIANMFLIPMGMAAGASSVTVKAFLLNNLLPVTIGNTLAGVFLVACMYHVVYGRPW